MNLGFVRVFKEIVFKRAFQCLLKVSALFSRKRNSKEDIFNNVGKKIDFPKVISYFQGQVAGLDEQKQRSREVNDKSHYEPEIGLLVDENHLRLVHLVEQVEY